MNDNKFFWSKLNPNSNKLREIIDNSIESLSEKLLESITENASINPNKHFEYMKQLIQKGADINYRSKNGKVVLCEAARYLDFTELKYLIKLGAYINTKDREGNTPLHNSIHNPNTENLILLLKPLTL